MKTSPLHSHEYQALGDDSEIANPEDDKPRWKRIAFDIFLCFGILFMLFWPWTFFVVVYTKGGIQLSSGLADAVQRYPEQVSAIAALVGTANRLAVTWLLGQAIVKLGQALITGTGVTVFDVSALFAFRYMTPGWGAEQLKGLTRRGWRLAIVVLLLATLGASALIPSGTAGLVTPGKFNKTAELRGTELDFTSSEPGCLAWLEENRVRTSCDWKVCLYFISYCRRRPNGLTELNCLVHTISEFTVYDVSGGESDARCARFGQSQRECKRNDSECLH